MCRRNRTTVRAANARFAHSNSALRTPRTRAARGIISVKTDDFHTQVYLKMFCVNYFGTLRNHITPVRCVCACCKIVEYISTETQTHKHHHTGWLAARSTISRDFVLPILRDFPSIFADDLPWRDGQLIQKSAGYLMSNPIRFCLVYTLERFALNDQPKGWD